MSDPIDLELVRTAPDQLVATPDGAWITAVRVLEARGAPVEVRTGEDEESGVLVLSGTHDLEAASGSWISETAGSWRIDIAGAWSIESFGSCIPDHTTS